MESILHQSWAAPIGGFIAFSLVFWVGYILRQIRDAKEEN